VKVLNCKTCGRPFDSVCRRRYCGRPECQWAKAPAVYRFICPDGRSYVGAVGNSRWRADGGLRRCNTRLLAAFEEHPPEHWTYEVLERLPPGCSRRELREAEQRHIDALCSWSPEAGFNILPAVEGDGPAQRAARQFRAAIIDMARKAQREMVRKAQRRPRGPAS
jgi:hypothetical protein